MKEQKFHYYITVAVSKKMNERIKNDSDLKGWSKSKVVRKMIRDYYHRRKKSKGKN
jgi:hypothetical protein